MGETNTTDVNAILVIPKIIRLQDEIKIAILQIWEEHLAQLTYKELETLEGTLSRGSIGFDHDSWGLLVLIAVALTQKALQVVFDSGSSHISESNFQKAFSWCLTQKLVT